MSSGEYLLKLIHKNLDSYLDSRTEEEKEGDRKIEIVTTTDDEEAVKE